MPSSSNSQSADDQCEHCHNSYSLIRRKKTCSVCRLSNCTNCAPRDANYSCRICVTCQLISNTSTADEQLSELKVKHLRSYLLAKNISHDTCTEKRDLVDLIKQNRHLPFTNLLNQQTAGATATAAATTTTQTKNNGPFTNLQSTVSSFANQMNNFASNIQDYVSNTVSDAMNSTLGDDLPPTNNSNNPNRGPFNQQFPPSGNFNPTTNNASTNQQPRRPQPTTTSPSASSTDQRKRQKSLSEIKTEENIEDFNIRELKEILAANFVDFKGCVEKSELIDKVRRLYRDRQNEKIKAREIDDLGTSDTELCKICMDAIADCVFLDCGHMVTCVKCGKLLAECPICRLNIVRVVRVFKS